jgi:hypothetical protein
VIGGLGLAFLYRLPLLGPILIIGCLSYVTAEEWHRVFAWLARFPGLNRLKGWLPIESGEPVEPQNSKKEEAASLVAVGDR